MKKISVLLFAMLLFLAGCSGKKVQGDTFVVGMECGYAPYNWTDSTKTSSNVAIDGNQYCDGYDVQIAKRLASSMGKELVIQKTSWEGLILSLKEQQIDAIIAGMSPTEERAKEIDFSNVYHKDDKSAFGVVVKKDGTFAGAQGIHDFPKARISAQIGTFHMELLEQLTGIESVENLKDFPTMTATLQAGELDGFVADQNSAKQIVASNPDLLYIKMDGESDGFELSDSMVGVAIGIRKGNTELLDQVNEALSHISREEQMALMEAAVKEEGFGDKGFFGVVADIWNQNSESFLRGTATTLIISLSATLFGFFIALFVAITRTNKVTNFLATVYVTVFRGTPMMVQAMIIYFGASRLMPGFRWSSLIGGNIIAGIIIVSINTGAYMAETIRSGIQAIDKGQFEAAKGLGFTHAQTMRHIILPQAIKNVIPAIGNELIVNVKDTSVLNMISVTELFFVSNGIASTTYKIEQTFLITSLIYLTLTIVLTFILSKIELKLDKTKSVPTSYPASVTDSKHLI